MAVTHRPDHRYCHHRLPAHWPVGDIPVSKTGLLPFPGRRRFLCCRPPDQSVSSVQDHQSGYSHVYPQQAGRIPAAPDGRNSPRQCRFHTHSATRPPYPAHLQRIPGSPSPRRRQNQQRDRRCPRRRGQYCQDPY